MSYLEYVIAAYAVFVVVLVWDFVAPRIGIAHSLRAARLLAARRRAPAAAPAPDQELTR
ncbi:MULTISPECIES: heme exporter protein CcmD [Luteimonas]|jgi:hypothetical protein|uniref:heme exporter protein CcmD n=1 Tax=Luteimonas TaxID=83614 RepID=UPI000C7E35B3|nr:MULTISPECIES: heme exporter protein CcmD [Luteimonas]